MYLDQKPKTVQCWKLWVFWSPPGTQSDVPFFLSILLVLFCLKTFIFGIILVLFEPKEEGLPRILVSKVNNKYNKMSKGRGLGFDD